MTPSPSKKQQSEPESTLGDLKSPPRRRNPELSSTPIAWRDLVKGLAPHTQRYTASQAARLLGNAQLAGIGEGTHRAAEMFRAQYDITKERIRNHNCRAVFIEADATDVAMVFRAFTEDPAKGQKILAKYKFPTLGNKGVSNLLSFIAKWNSKKPMDPVSVVGVDIQSKGAVSVLKRFERGLKQGDPLKPELQDFICVYEQTLIAHRQKRSTTESYKAVSKKAGALLPRLTDEFTRTACKGIKELYALFALSSVGREIEAPERRDKLMAKRVVAGVKEQSKNGKTCVVLAHNGHVNLAPRAECFHYTDGMGDELKGVDYRVLLQLAGGGKLAALKDDQKHEVTDYSHPSPTKSDLEKVLSNLSKKYFSEESILVDIDSAMRDKKLKKLLSETVFTINHIGTKKTASTTFTVHVPAICNLILFHPEVSPETFVFDL